MPQGDQNQGWKWISDLAAGEPVVTSESTDSAVMGLKSCIKE